MYGQQESWGTDLVSGASAIAFGYLMTSWAKAGSNAVYPLIGNAALGAGALGVKHLVRNEYGHESLEAIGYAGLANVGNWVAQATTTLGGKAAGAAPVFLPKASTKGGAAGAARAAAERAARELAGRTPQGDIVQKLQPTPGRTVQTYQYPEESVA